MDRFDHRHMGLSGGTERRGRAAMRFVRGTLAEWGRPGSGADRARMEDARLVAEELVANACAHAPGPEAVDLEWEGGCVTVSVRDCSPRRPAVLPYLPELPQGHGLHVVDRLALRWGTSSRSGGKAVWAVLPAWGPPAAAHRLRPAPPGADGSGGHVVEA